MTSGLGRPERIAGLLLPLFSCPSNQSWGIGEFADVPTLARWMLRGGLRLLQLLPLNEMASGQRSPYSALTTMALDPIFIHVPDVQDFQAIGGEASLDAAMRGTLEHARASRGVDYRAVRTLKNRALRAAFRRFLDGEVVANSDRAATFGAFVTAQAWWLDDYATFRAIHQATGGQSWRDWSPGVRDRDPVALATITQEIGHEILFHQYLQWVAHQQWAAARAEAGGLRIFGDFPFAAAGDSADVWAHQDLFSFDGTVGAPPDAFSEDGQDWKLPVPLWPAMAAGAYDWFGRRARRASDLFDGYRVDHVVGLYRTWVFPLDGRPPHFTPASESEQAAQGNAVLRAVLDAGGEVVAEDLGIIPPFVRQSLGALQVPGYKVMRWERQWDVPGAPFSDPRHYPAHSLATSGTHDTDTLATWWTDLGSDQRAAVLAIPSVHERAAQAALSPDEPFVPRVRDTLLEALWASGSDRVVIPAQDVFGWTDRINVPGTVDTLNWTWKLPWPVDALGLQAECLERQTTLRSWAHQHGR